MKDSIGCAVVGYGPTYNFGWMHGKWIEDVPALRFLAICEKDPERAAQARQDFPGAAVYEDLDEMLEREDIDLVSVVTSHNTHARLAVQCLQAGKHTVVEKPLCLNTAEADAMIRAAREAGKTLATFHNRRHDGNVRAIKEVIELGEIGQVFDIQLSACGYGRPDGWWRSRKEVSGGLFYDWGSHAIDWVLSMVPSPVKQVTGFFHKLLWHESSNEDQTRAVILFENGTVADITQSSIAYAGRPLWRILGTEGAVIDTGENAIRGYCQELIGPSGGSFKLITASGERDIPYKESDWITYYRDMADHLLKGASVPVSAEDGRRVIAVLETAEQSARSGRSEVPRYL
ncbi:MAG: Gfo/Idh/MocA family oxidoreductase [Armatimonadetes bacterium]|nr:Gfo/Idh/MocA family oxidoreductase [Armatimonadota bacterium]